MTIESKYGPHVAMLVKESRTILADPERVHELAGRRLALRCVELEDYFHTHVSRVGVIGRPNRGKTTLAFSYFKALENYGFPTRYVDLDIYTQSGLAISGRRSWSERPKRADAPKREVLASIRELKASGPGIVIADFPGRPENPYQPLRLKGVDMTILLGDDLKDRDKWEQLVSQSRRFSLWLRTQPDGTRKVPLDPTIYHLERVPKPYSLDVMTSLTRILEVIAHRAGLPIHNPWSVFSEPERVVLQEVLDFEYAPYAHGFEE